MLSEGRSGEVRTASGALKETRLGPYGDVITNDVGLGRYFEATRNGRLYTATTALNAALNVASPLGAAGTPVLALFNPSSSGKAASIIKAVVQVKIGATPVLNFPVWNSVAVAGITAAGNTTPTGLRIDGTSSTMRVYANTALTGGAAFALLRPFLGIGPAYSGTVTTGNEGVYTEETEGSIIVPPGAAVTITFDVAGTNNTGAVAIVWAETDWPL